jgi:Protein involved in initiation of plasmid replication
MFWGDVMPSKQRMSSHELAQLRNQKVIKSNELVQQRTHMLSVQEQKIVLFLISQLKPEQKEFDYQTFDIIDFCEMCGIDHRSGKHYAALKSAIKSLSDRSMWVIGEGEKGKKETLMRWLLKAEIEAGSGKIGVMIDPDMKPFLLELRERYTQFDLIYTLGMKSKYSVRLYEILKSYEKLNEPVYFTLERFKEAMGTEYDRWADVKRRIVEPALKEINLLSDLSVIYSTGKKGKSIVSITFLLRVKQGFDEQTETMRAIYQTLERKPAIEPIPGQIMLDGSVVE